MERWRVSKLKLNKKNTDKPKKVFSEHLRCIFKYLVTF